jgi:nucleotide-binding universal stress UspA family protein
VRAIHVLDWPYGPSDTVEATGTRASLTFDESQARYLASITRVFDGIAPRPDWLIQFATGEPGPVLVKQSINSQLLVVGTREHVGLGRLLTGSISHYCLTHADCPIVSVPTMINAGPVERMDQSASDTELDRNEIAVGVDLSLSARAALWAAEQARATGQNVRAIHAVEMSPAFNMELGMGAVATPMDASALDAAHREAILAVFDSIAPEPAWRLDFFSGEAGPVLVAESVGAALLAVGAKEHVGIGRLISGSVSHYCLSHARGPVIAVPAVRGHGTNEDHDQAAADTAAHTEG